MLKAHGFSCTLPIIIRPSDRQVSDGRLSLSAPLNVQRKCHEFRINRASRLKYCTPFILVCSGPFHSFLLASGGPPDISLAKFFVSILISRKGHRHPRLTRARFIIKGQFRMPFDEYFPVLPRSCPILKSPLFLTPMWYGAEGAAFEPPYPAQQTGTSLGQRWFMRSLLPFLYSVF
jgi:hypothetical protein